MILVTVGTHPQPFDRLVRAAEALAVSLGEEVVVQRGASRVPTPHCRSVNLLPHGELLALMERARLVVCHTGPSTLMQALDRGHVPVVVPRSHLHGEHVDGHQLGFARHLRGYVHVVEDPAELTEAVRRHEDVAARVRPLRARPAEIEATSFRFAALVDGLVRGRARARRDRLRSLRIPWRTQR